jgi:hypothetical protein
MKYFLLFIFALTAAAQPINYQGRLSDKSGSNVNGTKNFSLRIFDAKTGGKQIYEENVGAVTVNEGAYSFNFGENGKSVVTPTETIALADGEKQIFNYIVKNPPVLGEIKISGGGHSWTEAGSSDATKFTATANKNSGAISAIFLTGAPEAGENVSISYDHNSNGVMGALSRGGQAWLEISVGGETLSPRERLVAVPFALRAGVADSLKSGNSTMLSYTDYEVDISLSRTRSDDEIGKYYNNNIPTPHRFYIPDGLKKITIKIKWLEDLAIERQNIDTQGNGRWVKVTNDQYKYPTRFRLNGEDQFLYRGQSEVVLEDLTTGFSSLQVGFARYSKDWIIYSGNLSLVVLGE